MTGSSLQVALFVPNLIGYARVLSALAAFYVAFDDHVLFAWLYSISMGLDAVDGVAARAFKQTSQFGAVLDMVTDRFSTASLLVILSHLYKDSYMLFVCLIILDVVSHWAQMYCTLLIGASSHKKASLNPLLKWYYTFPYALLFVCVFNEGCLVALYLLYFTAGPAVFGVHFFVAAFYACLPVLVLKQIISVVQLWGAMATIAEYDTKQRTKQLKQ